MRPSLLDRALDSAVVPGYSRLGFALRGLGRDDDLGRTLAGRVALITGGSSGIGEAACEGLAAAGAHVHLVARDLRRGTDAIRRIESRVPGADGRIELELSDLSDLSDPPLRGELALYLFGRVA